MLKVNIDERKIDAVFAQVDQCHLPGVAVGIAVGGTPVYRKGFGLASMGLPVILSPSIRMRIGSMTKHFASLAFLLLCEEGRAGLEDPIGRYVPELHRASRAATMRQLMGHVSGLRDPFDLCWAFNGFNRHVTRAELLDYYRTLEDVNNPPEATWMYNNGGYLLLSTAIERLCDEPLADIFRKRIFEPVGMYDTLLHRWDTEYIPNSASLHYREPSGTYTAASLGTEFDGVGGISSTVDDMLRWLAHMDAPVVGSEATWKALRTPLQLANQTSTGYGLGLFTGYYRGVATVEHAGGVLSGNSQMLKIPSAGLDVLIMSNRSDASAMELTQQVLDVCLDVPPEEPSAEAPIACGTFHSAESGRTVQLFAKDGRQLAVLDGTDLPMETDTRGLLRVSGCMALSFKATIRLIGDREHPTAIRLTTFGTAENLRAVQATERCNARDIADCYRADAIDTDAQIFADAAAARLETSGRFGRVQYQLEALGEGLWRAKGPYELGGVLAFDPQCRRFEFSTPRTTRMPFARVES